MRRILVAVLIVALIFTLGACATRTTPNPTPAPGTTEPGTTPGTTTPSTEKGALKDGTYTGTGDKWEFGNEDATVVVSGGKIAQVTLRRLTAEGQEVNYEEWTGKEVGGKVYPNLKQFREDLAKEIVQKQSTEVNEISGATISSKNWKLAVDRALEQAEVK